MADDLRIFPDEFVPNVQASKTYQRWAKSSPGDRGRWEAFRDALLAGQMPTAPSMSTTFGRALVAAGKEHMSISHLVGVITDPYPPVPPPPEPTPSADWWAADSPINTSIGGAPTVLWDYGSAPFQTFTGINLNTGGWACAIFEDTSGSRRTITNPDGWKLDDVPLPPQWSAYYAAFPADTEKHHVVVDSDRIFNVYGAGLSYTTAAALGCMRAKTVSSGFWNNGIGPWLGRASGFCSAVGLVRKAELDAGNVPHALTCAWPKSSIRTTYVAPATSSDGNGPATMPPMGSRIQLDPSLGDGDFASYGIASYYWPLCRALQTFGAFISDSSSTMAIYGESWNDSGQCTYPGGWSPASGNLIGHLRIVSPPSAPTYDDRTVFGQPHNP